MYLFTHPAVRVVAAVTLLGTFVLARPLPAASGDLAQAVTATEAKENAAVNAKVEAHIKALHSKLHITSAQETQWSALAQVMRDNAHAIADLREEKAEQAKSMNAIEHLKAYAAITNAQAAGIHKFLPAFQALYDTMSDSQKKTADALFRSRALAAAKKHK
jgi:protein CpxP